MNWLGRSTMNGTMLFISGCYQRLAEGAFGTNGPMADGRERAFNRVRGSQMLPVLGRKIVEHQQCIAIFGEAFGGLGVLQLVALDEGIEGGLGSDRRLRHPDLL